MKRIGIIWILLFIMLFVVYSVYNYKHYGEALNKKATIKEKILTGYAYVSVLNRAKYRISQKHLGGRNTFYVSDDAIYNLAKSKIKTKETVVNLFRHQNGSDEIKQCIETMKLYNAELSYNCVQIRLRGVSNNIVCQLQETEAVPNGKYSECDISNSISSWYGNLDLP